MSHTNDDIKQKGQANKTVSCIHGNSKVEFSEKLGRS